MRRWNLWYVVVSAALGYALSWLVGDEPMDALVNAALAGLISFLIIERTVPQEGDVLLRPLTATEPSGPRSSTWTPCPPAKTMPHGRPQTTAVTSIASPVISQLARRLERQR